MRRGRVQALATRVLSLLMVLIGLVLLVSTVVRGGGPLSVGVIFGVLFAAAGAARIHLQERGREDG